MKPKSGMGQAVSTMSRPDEDAIEDSKKTVFDWCIDGDVTKVTQFLTNDWGCVNQKDENVSGITWYFLCFHPEFVRVYTLQSNDNNNDC